MSISIDTRQELTHLKSELIQIDKRIRFLSCHEKRALNLITKVLEEDENE